MVPSLARLGIGRVVYGAAYNELPAAPRDQERAFLATPRSSRSTRDEFNRIRTALDQAAQLTSLDDRPLAIVTAERHAEQDWFAMQDDLVTLSTNAVHRVVPDATHTMVVQDEGAAHQSSRAILDVVGAVRAGTPINGQHA